MASNNYLDISSKINYFKEFNFIYMKKILITCNNKKP